MTDDFEITSKTAQPLTDEEKELVSTINKTFELYKKSNAPYHDTAKKMREVLRLNDPDQDGKKRGDKKILQLNTLKSTFNNCVADQMENLPQARILPETADKEGVALDLQDIVNYITYTTNRYEGIHRRRAEDLYGVGTAVTQVTWDKEMRQGQGDIALIRWPIESFLWDPTAENLQDARALIKASWHPLSWYEQHYPDLAQYVRAENNDANKTAVSTLRDLDNNEDEGRALLLEYWYRTYDSDKRKYEINVAYCAGGALLEDKKDVYLHGMYPFVIDVHSTIEGSMVGDGMVQELVPTMRYINKYANYIDENLRMSSKGRIIARKGCGINRNDFKDWDKDIVEGDTVRQGEDWSWIPPPPFNGMIAQQMTYMQSDLKMDSGANQYTRGETTAGIVSGKALAALQEAGGKITGLRTDTLNHGFREITEQMLWLIAQMYDNDRCFMITGDDGNTKQVAISKEALFSGDHPPYMVQVHINKRNPLHVEAQNEMFMNAYTMAAQAQQQFPLSALFKLLNIDGKERVLPVILENEHQQEQMAQMQAQNAQLTEQMAQMQKENESLKYTTTEMTNAFAQMQAEGSATPVYSKVPSPNDKPDIVAQARQTLPL